MYLIYKFISQLLKTFSISFRQPMVFSFLRIIFIYFFYHLISLYLISLVLTACIFRLKARTFRNLQNFFIFIVNTFPYTLPFCGAFFSFSLFVCLFNYVTYYCVFSLQIHFVILKIRLKVLDFFPSIIFVIFFSLYLFI